MTDAAAAFIRSIGLHFALGWLRPVQWITGYAEQLSTRASPRGSDTELMALAFRQPHLTTLEMLPVTENPASRRVQWLYAG